MAHILVVSVQGHGHVYPSLGVVAELVNRGHRVSYVTTALFADAVAAAGATLVPYRSVFDEVHLPDLARQPDAEAQVHLLYLRENVAILRAAESGLAADPPELVMYDVFPFIAGRLLARRWGCPAARMWPIFAANQHYSVFEALWRSAGFGHPAGVAALRQEMTALLAGYGVTTPIREYWDEIEDLNLVFIPRSFQIAGETFDERFAFVGPNIEHGRQAGTWQPPGPDVPVLLVSLGNHFNEHPEFFRAFADALAGTPWRVVLAIGEFLDPAGLGPLPPNVEAHRWIPFRAVLPHATALVTQGTTGAVMEAFYWGRPVLVVPQFAPEAVPSADRVVALGLGHRLPPGQLTPPAVRAAVQRLADDRVVAGRVRQMQQDVRQAGGAARAADRIEAALAAPARPASAVPPQVRGRRAALDQP